MEQSLFSSTSLQPKQKNKTGKIRKKKEYTFSPQPLTFVLKRSSSFEIFYFSFYNFKFVLKWYCHELLFCFSLSSNIYKINKKSYLIRKSLPSSVSVQIIEILMNNFNRKSK